MPINIINAAVSYKSKEKKIDLTVSFDQFVVRFTIDQPNHFQFWMRLAISVYSGKLIFDQR